MAKTQGPTYQPNKEKKAKKCGFRARKNGEGNISRLSSGIVKLAPIMPKVFNVAKAIENIVGLENMSAREVK